jgi:hypothetical protein
MSTPGHHGAAYLQHLLASTANPYSHQAISNSQPRPATHNTASTSGKRPGGHSGAGSTSPHKGPIQPHQKRDLVGPAMSGIL